MTILYLLFTVVASFALIIGLPAMFVWALVCLRRKGDFVFLLRVLSAVAGFAAGMVLAWSIAVVSCSWRLPFWWR